MTFLSTERLILRPLEESDADGPYPGWLNDAAVCAGNSHHVRPYSRLDALKYIRSIGPTDVVLAITHVGKHVGNISLTHVHPLNRSAEIGWMIGKPEQGYGYEAGMALLQHAWSAMNLHRVYCGTYSGNTAMLKLAKKLGFQQEGIRKSAAWKDGTYVDVVEFGILR